MKIVKTLYVASAWEPDAQTPVQMTYFYAQTSAEAEERGQAWRDERHPHLPQLQVRQYPDGFHLVRTRLPGRIEYPET